MRLPNSRIAALIAAGTISSTAGCVDTSSPAPSIATSARAATGGSAATDATATGGANPRASDASSFHCVNWADPGDNFQAGVLQPSGLSSSDDYATVLAKSNAILSGFQTLLGVNAIRIPINESTVVTNPTWWTAYKAIIDVAISQNVKVMIAYWGQAGSGGGKPADLNVFFTMWQSVVDAYGTNELVYFDVMNEPWAYPPTDFINLVVQWMGKFPSVPANRVVVAGNYNDSNVLQQGADPRLASCLLSVHIYSIDIVNTNVSYWSTALASAYGPYASRTIVSEYGQEMTSGFDYGGDVNGNGSIAFMQGVTSQMRTAGLGSCYWPGLRIADHYSITQLNGTGTDLSLTVTNASGLALIQSAWGM